MNSTSRPDTSTAEYYLHNWVPAIGVIETLQMSEQGYRDSFQLDARIRTAGTAPSRYELTTLEPFFREQPSRMAPIIFHTGHCGSTLLSRVLSGSPNILPVREPMPLWQLADNFAVLDHSTRLLNREQWNLAARVLLYSYSRTFGDHQTALIKATSTSNNLIVPLIKNKLLKRAVLLYQPLISHLAATLRAAKPSDDLRSQAVPRMREWMKIPGAPSLYVSDLSPGQLSVVSWLSSMVLMLEALEQYPGYCQLQNFNYFLADPEKCVSRISEFLGFASESASLLESLPGVLSRNSKITTKAFSASDRQRKHAEVIDTKADQVADAMGWAEELIRDVAAFSKCHDYLRDH